jgi:hypothetical protein
MKTKTAIVMLVIGLTAFLVALPAHGNGSKGDETKAKLEILVDEYIACCDAKSAMRNSRSENIRRSAVRSCMKAEYCRHSKDELVREMLENDIKPKAYKVRLFLNEKFHAHVQAKE